MDPMGMGGGNGFFSDPSTAWFLPFNMEPPTLGDDGGVFTAGEGFNFGLGQAGLVEGHGGVGGAGQRGSVSLGGSGGMEGLEGLESPGQ